MHGTASRYVRVKGYVAKKVESRREMLCREELTKPNPCAAEPGFRQPCGTEPRLARGFEPSKARRRKKLRQVTQADQLIVRHDLNTIFKPQPLVPTMRKPFDVLAEGLVFKNSRGDSKTRKQSFGYLLR